MFTQSRFAGPSIELSRESALRGDLRGMVVMSRNANVAIGERGPADAREVRQGAADIAGLSAEKLVIAALPATAAETNAVADAGAFATSGRWVPVVVGIVIALAVSLVKSLVRPVANVATAGVAAPVLSTIEDVTSVGLVLVAILLPALVVVFVLAIGWAAVTLWRRRKRHAASET